VTFDGLAAKILALSQWQEWKFLPVLVLGPIAAYYLVRVVAGLVRYATAAKDVRPMFRRAWKIRYRWKRDARRVGLMQIERGRPRLWSSTPATAVIERELFPSVKVTAERWGVGVDASTLGRLGLKQFQDAAPYLADMWKVPQVRVEQVRPGVVRLRAIVRDPLTEPAPWTPATVAPRPADPGSWHAGVDADGQPVTIRSSEVSGVVVAGLAGYGKTSFLNARLT
jgi:hypothetical protein